MNSIKIGNDFFPCTVTKCVEEAGAVKREVCRIKSKEPYEKVKKLFSNAPSWSVVHHGISYRDTDDKGNPVIVAEDDVLEDFSDYCVVCQIAENMDGTTTITMGKMTAQEILNIILGGEQV